jgi:hypothetical protein
VTLRGFKIFNPKHQTAQFNKFEKDLELPAGLLAEMQRRSMGGNNSNNLREAASDVAADTAFVMRAHPELINTFYDRVTEEQLQRLSTRQLRAVANAPGSSKNYFGHLHSPHVTVEKLLAVLTTPEFADTTPSGGVEAIADLRAEVAAGNGGMSPHSLNFGETGVAEVAAGSKAGKSKAVAKACTPNIGKNGADKGTGDFRGDHHVDGSGKGNKLIMWMAKAYNRISPGCVSGLCSIVVLVSAATMVCRLPPGSHRGER